jgi:heptosyltransferase-1
LKILIVKLSSLGDVVHAMPAVQDMLQAVPHAQIDWVVERGFAPLVRRCAGVHRVIECELRRWRKSPFSAQTRQGWRAFKAELQRESYDAVIDLQGLSKSALVAWLAQLAPQGKRYGLANRTEGSSFEAPARWVAQVPIQVPVHSAAVSRSRLLCARALGYAVPEIQSFGLLAGVNEGLESSKSIAFSGTGASGRRGTVALVHGTSRADKEWPLASWQALGQKLNASGFAVAVPHGSDSEQLTAQAIASTLSDAVVWPRLGLDALTDALATCAGVIGVDSGLSHIAVALDLPHVQLYNFDTAWRTGPLLSAHQCSLYAQPAPSVDAVWRAWQAVLRVSGGA